MNCRQVIKGLVRIASRSAYRTDGYGGYWRRVAAIRVGGWPLGDGRDLAVHLDGILGHRQRLEQISVAVESLHGVREQLREPPVVLCFGQRHVFDTTLEVLAIRVDSTDHDLVSEHEPEIDLVGRHVVVT